nr:glycosyltransferase family 39 protein [Endomicrobiaceae bacterium]
MKKYFNNSSVIIFIMIAMLYAIGNFIWWKLNTPIIPYGICALHFLNIFDDGIFYYNAPLITWIMKAIFFVFGKEYFDLQIIIMNYIFFLIALYFVYKIGVELKDKETGNIAMLLFALTPVVYELSKQYGHKEYHVMVAMTVNIYCLIKLNFFKNRKWSILYGITVGLGLLVKDEFLPYFFTPWLYVVIKGLIEKTDKNRIINILITIIIGSLIAGCHYFKLGIICKVLLEPIVEMVPVFSFESLRITTIGLSEYLLSPFIFILFIIGLIWFVYKYKSQNKWIILLWFTVPWMIITFMPHHKLAEYCLGF